MKQSGTKSLFKYLRGEELGQIHSSEFYDITHEQFNEYFATICKKLAADYMNCERKNLNMLHFPSIIET